MSIIMPRRDANQTWRGEEENSLAKLNSAQVASRVSHVSRNEGEER